MSSNNQLAFPWYPDSTSLSRGLKLLAAGQTSLNPFATSITHSDSLDRFDAETKDADNNGTILLALLCNGTRLWDVMFTRRMYEY